MGRKEKIFKKKKNKRLKVFIVEKLFLQISAGFRSHCLSKRKSLHFTSAGHLDYVLVQFSILNILYTNDL